MTSLILGVPRPRREADVDLVSAGCCRLEDSMKPHVIMHMMSSIDGRIVTTDWPKTLDVGDVYERVHADLRGGAWIVGRATMAEFAAGEPRPISTEKRFPARLGRHRRRRRARTPLPSIATASCTSTRVT